MPLLRPPPLKGATGDVTYLLLAAALPTGLIAVA